MNPSTRPPCRPHAAAPRRRGVAMLLVLVSLSMASILAVSYLASRDNSSDIGENIAAAASARWAAASGLDLSTAVLETDTTWRTVHTDGTLIDDFSIAGAIVDIELRDLLTNKPPDADTTCVEITVTAIADGLEQRATATVMILGGRDADIDVDLSEFALFGAQGLVLADSSTVTRWPNAPLTALGRRVNLGTNATEAGQVSIAADAAALDATIYRLAGASDALVSQASPLIVEEFELIDPVPTPSPPSAGAAPPGAAAPVELFFTSQSLGADLEASSVQVTSSEVTITGDVAVTSGGDVRLAGASRVVVDGHLKLVVYGDFAADGSTIELRGDSTLTLFVAGRLDIVNSYLGDENGGWDNTGAAAWMHPERLRVFALPGGPGGTETWTVGGTSVVKGAIYAPDKTVQLQDAAACYGCITAGTARLEHAAALFYDHALDTSWGYTDPDGPLYEDDGTLKGAVTGLVSLDASEVETLSTTLKETGSVIPPGMGFEPQPTVTPRTVLVDHHLTSHGVDVLAWESSVAEAASALPDGTAADGTSAGNASTGNLIETSPPNVIFN